MQSGAAEGAAIQRLRVAAKVVDRATDQQRRHVFGDIRFMIGRAEDPVAAGGAGEDHVRAIAERHLSIVEHQHEGQDLGRFRDAPKARRDRIAVKDAAIGARAAADGRQVEMQIPGAAAGADDLPDSHGCSPGRFSFRRARPWPHGGPAPVHQPC